MARFQSYTVGIICRVAGEYEQVVSVRSVRGIEWSCCSRYHIPNPPSASVLRGCNPDLWTYRTRSRLRQLHCSIRLQRRMSHGRPAKKYSKSIVH